MEQRLSRQEISDAVGELGWRLVLGTLRTSVRVGSLRQGAEVVARAVEACGKDADRHLRADVRPRLVVLTLESAREIEPARRISGIVREAGLRTEPQSVQLLEIGIDALDIPAIRPFWKAILVYADEAGADGPADPLVDPAGTGPAVWFQQMDVPRTERNRLHVDISVPHDEAPRRIEAALAAGGRLVSDASAPAFWVLADAEGNEACVTTWQGRDG